MPDGISFESLHKKKHYLRARDNFLILEAYEDSDEFSKLLLFVFDFLEEPFKDVLLDKQKTDFHIAFKIRTVI